MTWLARKLWSAAICIRHARIQLRRWAEGECFRHEWTYWAHDPVYSTWEHTCTKCKLNVLVKQRPADYED